MITAKERSEHRRLSRRILHGKPVTRAQIRRAFELLEKVNAAARAEAAAREQNAFWDRIDRDRDA